ncbi:hypothetical protein ALC56_06208, partial [Trachymyrmex septentrionalis]
LPQAAIPVLSASLSEFTITQYSYPLCAWNFCQCHNDPRSFRRPPLYGVPLKSITKKLMLLLALDTGHHAQTLSSLRLSQILIGEKLMIPNRLKTSAPDHFQPFFCFSLFANHENLCIVLLIKHYINKEVASSCDAAERRVTSELIKRAASWTGESRVF